VESVFARVATLLSRRTGQQYVQTQRQCRVFFLLESCNDATMQHGCRKGRTASFFFVCSFFSSFPLFPCCLRLPTFKLEVYAGRLRILDLDRQLRFAARPHTCGPNELEMGVSGGRPSRPLLFLKSMSKLLTQTQCTIDVQSYCAIGTISAPETACP